MIAKPLVFRQLVVKPRDRTRFCWFQVPGSQSGDKTGKAEPSLILALSLSGENVQKGHSEAQTYQGGDQKESQEVSRRQDTVGPCVNWNNQEIMPLEKKYGTLQP